MSESTPATRRWFRFSLRTLFVVVTIFAIWLGGERKYVRDRRAMAEFAIRNNGSVAYWDEVDEPNKPSFQSWRRWLGDVPVAGICLGPRKQCTEADIEKANHLFPEADSVVPYSRKISAERH